MGLRAAVFTCAFPQARPVSLSRRPVAFLQALVAALLPPATQGAGAEAGLFSLRAGIAALSRSRSRREGSGDKSGSNWGKSFGSLGLPLVAHFLG